ncbi:MAG: hypothetical protein WB799_00385 [Candidatus Sulfotelmatobacter sp.]
MTDKPKSQANQSHADPDKGGRDQYKRHVDGDITVRGQIETHIPPDAAQQHNTEREEDKTRAKKNYVVGILTLVAVVIYAGIAGWQGCLNRSLVQISQRTFDTSQRPYIGDVGIQVVYQFKDAQGEVHTTQAPVANAERLNMVATTKNYGPVPGTDFTVSWRIFVDEQEVPMKKIPDRPSPMFPTETRSLSGSLGMADCHAIRDGVKTLIVELTLGSYGGPTGRYPAECKKYQFDRDKTIFYNLGPTCTH